MYLFSHVYIHVCYCNYTYNMLHVTCTSPPIALTSAAALFAVGEVAIDGHSSYSTRWVHPRMKNPTLATLEDGRRGEAPTPSSK